ncbi:putative transcription factor interactor and regulator CCHC(Zn) family [Medicago truncatula]|uniref:Putative transcription factor interactor and regulator CCHC(Zn) family n=1 Tax=Medicago truncatula TaxID=3880 RepID=A0A396JL67_MEDTR|nr:putative transcription factor interactor and regulator CCHC(Zn) family [Medicago truncatula]
MVDGDCGSRKMTENGGMINLREFQCKIGAMMSVWSNGTWNLKPGLLRLSRWSPDFNSFNQKQTHSQVWLRFHYLPLEYWQPITLFEIAGAIGTPILIDESTRNHSFGHYACILVDINLAGFLPESLWVEREKFTFEIEIEYENPPYYCFTCNSIGHSTDHCKKDLANKIACEMVSTKNAPAKQFKHDPKKYVVKECRKGVADEDPIISDIIRSKEVETSALIRNIINFEEELSASISVGTARLQSTQIEDVQTTELIEKQREDQHSSKFPDMRIVGPWSDVVTDLDYIQDPLYWCGLESSNVDVSKEVLNPNVAHDLEILQKHVWNGSDARGIGPRVYTDEEENAAALNYLKNRGIGSTTTEEPFIEVMSKAKKKKVQKGFQIHNTRSRVSYCSCLFVSILLLLFSFWFVFAFLLFLLFMGLTFVPIFALLLSFEKVLVYVPLLCLF